MITVFTPSAATVAKFSSGSFEPKITSYSSTPPLTTSISLMIDLSAALASSSLHNFLRKFKSKLIPTLFFRAISIARITASLLLSEIATLIPVTCSHLELTKISSSKSAGENVEPALLRRR